MRSIQFIFLLGIVVFNHQACGGTTDRKKITEINSIEGMVVDTTKEKTFSLNPVDTSIQYIMGKFEPSEDSNFIEVDIYYADRPGMFIRKDVYSAFVKMDSAAREDGIVFQIRSAARNFEYQKGIWERKWTGKTTIENGEKLNETTPDPVQRALKILKYSSMPGSSRHHWGTDIDLNSFSNSWFESGEGKRLYDWLEENGPEYGFRQPYTAKGAERPDGYNEERWHWSFYPVADILTEVASRHLKDSMIDGFKGAETATKIGVVKRYVLGINPQLLTE
ncbi:M15 family metallopeptidase [Membranihabitans maritimus]|uniref:M15 family metallopeptidase n=1 Tax=Membranihabitans maritimus TaxID=2904244 RepID=UPI001F2EB3BD|nr:M15 family metallopeptidase [Membranihabitans maritimus]